MASASGTSGQAYIPVAPPTPSFWYNKAEDALRYRFELSLKEGFPQPDIHPRYIDPTWTEGRRFEQLLLTLSGIRQRAPEQVYVPILILVRNEGDVLELRDRLNVTQWHNAAVYAFRDNAHYGRCDEALEAFRCKLFQILVMTEEEGLSHFQAEVRATVWYDSPSFALSFFRFYGASKEVHWLIRPYFDYPILSGLILLYHQAHFYAPTWLTFAFRECCRETGNGDYVIQSPRLKPNIMLEKIDDENYPSFYSGVSIVDSIIKSVHRDLVWATDGEGTVIPRIPPIRNIPEDVAALMS